MSGVPLLLTLVAALGRPPGPGAGDDRRIYPGFAAFEPPATPAIPAELRRPLFQGRRFESGWFVWTPAASGELLAAPESIPAGGLAIPGGARLVWLDGGRDWRALRTSPRTAWLGRYQPAYKLDPALVLDEESRTPLRLRLEPIPGHPRERLVAELEDLGARVLVDEDAALVIDAPARLVGPIARLEGLYRLYEDEEELAPRHGGRLRDDGGGSSSERLVIPITVALSVTQGRNSKSGTLAAADLGRLRASDDDRVVLRDRETLALGFDDAVPAEAVVGAVRVFVEHHEEAQLQAGEVLWKLAYGPLNGPTVVRTLSAPVRAGASLERLDLWSPDGLVPDFGALVIVIENGSPNDDTLLDRVYVEVDYTLPAHAPEITSTPSPLGTLGAPYLYDADGRAEASGDAPLAWTLVGGPVGFTLDSGTGLVRWTPDARGSFPVSLRVANAHGSATQSFVVEVPGEPPLPPTLLPVNPTSLAYCPPERIAEGPAKSQQRLNVFLPRGTPPASGWPVVLNNRAGGGIPSAPLASLSDTGGTAALHAFVADGVAVVDFGVTAIGSGEGLFYPPGHASGRYESFRPGDDNPEKDAEWAVQWVKTQSAFPLDAESVCLRGSSHGAIISIWAAMGPERARASGSPQVTASTRVKGVLALQPPTSVWAFLQSADLAVRMVAHFEQAAAPGVPATAFGQVAEGLQKDASVMRFAFQTPEARANNAAQAVCLVYAEPVKLVNGAPADLTLDAAGYPRLHGVLAQPYIHDSWSGYVLWRRLIGLSPRAAAFHGERSVFAVKASTALPPPFDDHTRTFSGGVTGTGARAIAHEWVLATLGVMPRVPRGSADAAPLR